MSQVPPNQAAPLHGQPETVVHQAAVKEVIKPTQVSEVQQVVHREVNTTEVHQVTQPIIERSVLPTQVTEAVLPTTVRPDVIHGGQPVPMPQEQSSRVVEGASHTTVVKPAVIQEVHHNRVIEEVQPVIYREVIAPSVVHQTQHINERVIEAPIITREVRQPIVHQGQGFGVGHGQAFHNQGFGHGGQGLPFGIGLRGEQKAQYFEQKAALYQQQGNQVKAQRNLAKAARTRQRVQARSAPGFVAKNRIPGQLNANQNARIQRYEQRSTTYEQSGNHWLAIRNREKANFLRRKAGVAPFNYPVHPGAQGLFGGQGQGFAGQPGAVGVAQPGLGQGVGQPGLGQGVGQPGLGQGVGQPGLGQGVAQPGLAQGLSRETLPTTTPGHHYAPAGVLGSGFGLRGEEKAQHFENKAEEWAKAGNQKKAETNRNKALRIRNKAKAGKSQTVRTPGTLTPKQQEKIQRFETRAAQADTSNNPSKAIRSREKANRVRTKAGVPHTVYPHHQPGYTSGTSGTSGTAHHGGIGGLLHHGQHTDTTQHGSHGAYTTPTGHQPIAGRVGSNTGGLRTGTTHPSVLAAQGQSVPFGIGLRGEQKAQYFEQKAAQYQQQGNQAKAQRNLSKAARTRQRVQARSAPGYVPKHRVPGSLNANQTSRIQRYEQRARDYELRGDYQKAIRNRQKANFLRNKAGLPPTNYPINPAAQGLAGTPAFAQPPYAPQQNLNTQFSKVAI